MPAHNCSLSNTAKQPHKAPFERINNRPAFLSLIFSLEFIFHLNLKSIPETFLFCSPPPNLVFSLCVQDRYLSNQWVNFHLITNCPSTHQCTGKNIYIHIYIYRHRHTLLPDMYPITWWCSAGEFHAWAGCSSSEKKTADIPQPASPDVDARELQESANTKRDPTDSLCLPNPKHHCI